MRERERERERGRDTGGGRSRLHAPGARRGTRSQNSKIAPWAKGRRQTAEPPRDPQAAWLLIVIQQILVEHHCVPSPMTSVHLKAYSIFIHLFCLVGLVFQGETVVIHSIFTKGKLSLNYPKVPCLIGGSLRFEHMSDPVPSCPLVAY